MPKAFIALAVPAIVLLAACSSAASSASTQKAAGSASSSTAAAPATSAADGATTSPATTSPATADAGKVGAGCESLSGAAVTAIVGFPVSAPKTGGSDPVILCTYTGTPVGTVLIRKQTGVDAATFKGDREAMDGVGEKTTDMPGVGDTAYSATIGSGEFVTSTVVALHGTNEVLASINGPKTSVPVAAAVVKAAIQAYGF